MTDFDSMQNMQGLERVGIPSSLITGDRPAAVEAKKMYHVAPAENRNNNPGATMRFTLPCQANTYLMPNVTLNVGVKFVDELNTLTTNQEKFVNFDGGASSIIDRIRIFHGSQLLEDIQEYSRIRKLVTDITQDPANTGTIGNLLQGEAPGSEPQARIVAAAPAAVNQASANVLLQALQTLNQIPTPRACEYNGSNADNSTFTNGETHNFVISLMSGVIGSMCQKAFPAHACTGSPLRVEIDLASRDKAIVSSIVPTVRPGWSLVDCELHATYVQVSSNAQALIDQATGGVYGLNTYTYTHAQQTLDAAASSSTILLPFAYSSLKHVVSGIYTGTPGIRDYNISGRHRDFITSVHWQIGAARVPSQPLQGIEEIIAGALECYGVSSDLLQICNHIDHHLGLTNVSGTAGVTQTLDGGTINHTPDIGKFCLGLDAEAFGATSSATRIENGINTTAIQMYVVVSASEAYGNAHELHTWGQYDMLVSCQNGQAYARF